MNANDDGNVRFGEDLGLLKMKKMPRRLGWGRKVRIQRKTVIWAWWLGVLADGKEGSNLSGH